MKKELSEEDQANAQRRAQAEGMRTRGLAAFARPISSVALCATVYTKGKKSAQQHHIDEIQEGEVFSPLGLTRNTSSKWFENLWDAKPIRFLS